MTVAPFGSHPVQDERAHTVYRATWRGAVIAESDDTIVVEGNHYFPPQAIRSEFLRPSPTHTRCRWKGVASYYDLVVRGTINPAPTRGRPRPWNRA